jgi:hypoxanthine phosphoribosyltransferase
MSTTVLFNEQQIQDAIKTLAQDLNTTTDYWAEDNVFVGVLNGGFMFYTDLVKQINFNIECDFVRTKSYVTNRSQIKPVVIKDTESDLENKNVFLIDDILDSGNTMKALLDHFLQKKPLSINIITLFVREGTKFENRFGKIYNCLYVKDDSWLGGYGMDDNGLHRNLPYVFVKE